MDESVAFINGDTNAKFIVDKGHLVTPGDYQAVLKMFALEFDDSLIWESVNGFQIVSQPQGGSITIDKS